MIELTLEQQLQRWLLIQPEFHGEYWTLPEIQKHYGNILKRGPFLIFQDCCKIWRVFKHG